MSHLKLQGRQSCGFAAQPGLRITSASEAMIQQMFAAQNWSAAWIEAPIRRLSIGFSHVPFDKFLKFVSP